MKKFLLAFLATINAWGAVGGGNIAQTLANNVNQEIVQAGSSVATIVNTLSIVMGVIWIIIMLLMAFFNIEGIKNHAKLLFGALVIIGVVYGLSNAAI